MSKNSGKRRFVHLNLDLDIIVEDESELKRFARAVVIEQACEFDSGDLEDQLHSIASGPSGAIMMVIDWFAFIEAIPGVSADGAGMKAYDLIEPEQ